MASGPHTFGETMDLDLSLSTAAVVSTVFFKLEAAFPACMHILNSSIHDLTAILLLVTLDLFTTER